MRKGREECRRSCVMGSKVRARRQRVVACGRNGNEMGLVDGETGIRTTKPEGRCNFGSEPGSRECQSRGR
jgi:hypothetical protein